MSRVKHLTLIEFLLQILQFMHNTTQKMNTKKAAALIELSVSLFFNFIMFVLLRELVVEFMSDVEMLIQTGRITNW